MHAVCMPELLLRLEPLDLRFELHALELHSQGREGERNTTRIQL